MVALAADAAAAPIRGLISAIFLNPAQPKFNAPPRVAYSANEHQTRCRNNEEALVTHPYGANAAPKSDGQRNLPMLNI